MAGEQPCNICLSIGHVVVTRLSAEKLAVPAPAISVCSSWPVDG